jgi:formylglycine-generating enzyme required for sulfatase activity
VNPDKAKPKPPFLTNQRLSLLTGTDDVLRHLDVEAFAGQRDRGGYRGDEQGKDSPWRPLTRDAWLAGLRGDGRFRRCVVVADAGLGKSTNLAWLNAALARQQRQFLTFCLPIEQLPSSTDHLFDLLLDGYWRDAKGCGLLDGLTPALARDRLQHYRRTGRLVLLLDSLDQTTDNGQAEQTLQKLLTRAAWSRCPLVFTTRPHALSSRWHRVFKPHQTDWQFVRIEQLDREQQRRLLGDIVDAGGRVARYDLIPIEARGSLGVPRVCEIFRKLEQRDQFKGLATLADVTWKATTEMLLEGLKACEAGNKLAWNPGRGEPPNPYRPVQRDIAFHLLAALAFQTFVNPNEQNEPGPAPNLEGVPETATEPLLLGTLNRLLEAKGRLEAERRPIEARQLGSGDLADFFVNFDAVCAMNAGPLENYLLDHLGRHKELRWRNPTLQAFFAAAWACRFASPEDLALCRRWVVDPWNDATAVYAEFWRFASEMKAEALHRPTWVALMSLLYDQSITGAEGFPIRSTEFIYRSWKRMQGTPAQQRFLEEFPALLRDQHAIALALADDFVDIPAGTFQMGALDGEAESNAHERPRHPVTLSAFRMNRYAVTNAQYELFDPGHRRRRGRFYADKKHPRNDDRRPVVDVSWYDAKCFARWTGNHLPTEAQWEYSCRGGASSQIFHVGESLTSRQANFDGRYPYGTADRGGTYLECTTEVGSYEPNRFGLYDMHGNVWELCKDWYAADFYATDQARERDPVNRVPASARVLRGGSWISSGRFCRSAYRFRFEPDYRNRSCGFRLAAVPAVGAEAGKPARGAEATPPDGVQS